MNRLEQATQFIDEMIAPHVKRKLRDARDRAVIGAITICWVVAMNGGDADDCIEELGGLLDRLRETDEAEDKA
ncbi:hypothetical protein ACKWRH_23635 [Bradyrhizobium sp. Pa8]|uniref:hypothetical protein n=1 Tax=Bradyrhizobium sp. Pa8 TaxID=3386552 RepID=UPI00403F2ADA